MVILVSQTIENFELFEDDPKSIVRFCLDPVV
jgi:hypothetical protein